MPPRLTGSTNGAKSLDGDAAAMRSKWRLLSSGLAGWALTAPATLAVIGFLLVPIGIVIAGTFMDPRGIFAPYVAYFNSGFRTTVLFRTLQIAALTTIISLIFGFITAYVVSRAPSRLKSLLIIAAVFPLLTGVVVRAFAWLIILGRNGILNNTLVNLGIISEPLELLYTQGAVIIGMVYLFVPLIILSLAGVHRKFYGLRDAAASGRRAPDRSRDASSAARHGLLRLGWGVDNRHHHDRDHYFGGDRDESSRATHQSHGY